MAKCHLSTALNLDLSELPGFGKAETFTKEIPCLALAKYSFWLVQIQSIFSSPEHEVLMVSCCDRAVSVVCRPSSTFYLVYTLEATFSVQSSWNLVRMFVSIKSRTSSKLGHVGSKLGH